MASPAVGVLCAVLLFVCTGDAARPYHQFEAVRTTPNFCPYHGVHYSDGEPVPGYSDDPCDVCRCDVMSLGSITCHPGPGCNWLPCFDAVHVPNQCCPICPNGPNCQADVSGKHVIISVGQTLEVNGHNCRAHPSGQIIPVGVQVEVDGRQCYCSPEGAGLQVMCTATTTTTLPTTTMTPARPTTSTTT
uniref:VWFC domain-containing protein n=1 Tax=Branchiostoma floridae TaxID=7739 RepID=C3YAP9_BRAFL|eukprot:XP_002606787.1 hypothetical protein BRAFLDRAFT_82429 [Branchiostoma floridae]